MNEYWSFLLVQTVTLHIELHQLVQNFVVQSQWSPPGQGSEDILLVRFSTQLSWPHNCTLWMSLSTWHVYWLTPSKKCQKLLCIYRHWAAPIELTSFIGLPAKAIRIESAEMHYKLTFVNHNSQAIYPILVKGWQTIRDAREDIWYCLKVNRFK